MADSIYMDVSAVRGFSGNFNNLSHVLKGTSVSLQGLSMLLRTTAFVGTVGGAAVAQYIDFIRPQIDQMAMTCEELSGDLEASAKAYENGDQVGSSRFH